MRSISFESPLKMELFDSIEHKNSKILFFSRWRGYQVRYYKNLEKFYCKIFSLLVTEMLKYDEMMPKPVILCIIHWKTQLKSIMNFLGFLTWWYFSLESIFSIQSIIEYNDLYLIRFRFEWAFIWATTCRLQLRPIRCDPLANGYVTPCTAD